MEVSHRVGAYLEATCRPEKIGMGARLAHEPSYLRISTIEFISMLTSKRTGEWVLIHTTATGSLDSEVELAGTITFKFKPVRPLVSISDWSSCTIRLTVLALWDIQRSDEVREVLPRSGGYIARELYSREGLLDALVTEYGRIDRPIVRRVWLR